MAQSLNSSIITGILGRDPELRFTTTGKPVASFSMVYTPRYQDRSTNEWKDGETRWYDVEVWNALAENVAASLRKGNSVVVEGQLLLETYKSREGEDRAKLLFKADSVLVPLNSQTVSEVSRVKRTTSGVNDSASGQGGYEAPNPDGDSPF